MLGFYNYTVIITYLSVVSAMLGINFATQGEIKAALMCLLVSGLCDMLDGAVARTRKRTPQERNFGVQIDSLCDCISFGVQPAFIIYFLAKTVVPDNTLFHNIAFGVCIAFALCAVIRLGYFNVMEEERQKAEGTKRRTSYRGLPVTNVSLILPPIYLTHLFLSGMPFAIVMLSALAIVGFLFLLDFKFVKLHGAKLIPVGLFGTALLIALILT